MGKSSGERFVFKQWYKPMNEKSTRVLNQKHLIYIATRPGAIRNPGCGFGLFGKLPEMNKMENIDDLGMARKLVGEVSDRRTIYRAVLSVDDETAKTYSLYERQEWEKLLRSHLDVIRRGMNIKKEDFCWTASMHHEKGHPHVHIMYWDNGKEPRQEFVNEKRFEEFAGDLRRTLTAALEHPLEIREALNESKAVTKDTRKELAAMFKEANLADVLDLHHIKPPLADQLGRELVELAATMPKKGSLKYAYLPAGYKEKLDAYLDHVLDEVSDFKKLERQYMKLHEEISTIYGNSPTEKAKRLEEARERFKEALGNETMKYLKEVKKELEAKEPPEDEAQLRAAVTHAVHTLARERPDYKELLTRLPAWRVPFSAMLKDETTKKLLNNITNSLCDDIRIRAKADALFHKEVGEGATKEEKVETAKEINKVLRSAVHSTLLDTINEDKGYDSQEFQDAAMMCLLRVFRDVSQEKNRVQSQRDLLREKRRNLSETAKKDLRHTEKQKGDWTPDM